MGRISRALRSTAKQVRKKFSIPTVLLGFTAGRNGPM